MLRWNAFLVLLATSVSAVPADNTMEVVGNSGVSAQQVRTCPLLSYKGGERLLGAGGNSIAKALLKDATVQR